MATFKWQVGHNFGGVEVSLDTGGFEHFKSDSMESFAREIVQNSVDAIRKDKDKVKIEFKLFDMKVKDIPDYLNLKKGIENVYLNWKQKKKTKKNDLRRMKEMKELLDNEIITCMRISDFNTTGLLGVLDKDETSPFYALTKGDGMSFKDGTKGGSKGIGKFAAFVVSKLHAIFYSTLTETKDEGHMGIAKLPSGLYIENEGVHPNFKTNGEWYFAVGEEKRSIEGQLFLDKNFSRGPNDTGTDIYILGFNEEANWQNTVIQKILESFMVAIVKDKLEVEVDGTTVDSETVEYLIDNIGLRESRILYKNIRASYELLTEDKIYKKEIIVPKYGKVDFYLKDYNKDDKYASRRVTMIRYPYMKIKDLTNITQIPFSALVIINDDKINSILRKFENPEHTDWLFKSPDYLEEEKIEAQEIFRFLRDEIIKEITTVLFSSDLEEIDAQGAEEYLPFEESGNLEQEKTPITIEKAIIHMKKPAKRTDDIGYQEDVESDAIEPELVGADGEEETIPGEEGNGGDNGTPGGEGEEYPIFKKEKLKGIRYHLIAINPINGEYAIRFNHHEDLESCDLEFRIAGDSLTNEKHDFIIYNASLNGKELDVINNKVTNFNISKDQQNTIFITTDQKELFSGVVTVYASR